jgi:energy-coupling factor transporter ATP-binding protein EcfA2
MDKEPIIEAHGLTKTYRMGGQDVYALRDMDLEVYQGEYLSVMGPSGSGKSTLFNLIGALDRPSGGTVIMRKISDGAVCGASAVGTTPLPFRLALATYNKADYELIVRKAGYNDSASAPLAGNGTFTMAAGLADADVLTTAVNGNVATGNPGEFDEEARNTPANLALIPSPETGGPDAWLRLGVSEEGTLDLDAIKQEQYDAGYAAGEVAGYAAGYDDGYLAGYAAGEVVGYATGYDVGYGEGEAAGYIAGYAAAEALFPAWEAGRNTLADKTKIPTQETGGPETWKQLGEDCEGEWDLSAPGEPIVKEIAVG